MKRVRIVIGGRKFEAEINESECARSIGKSLPIEGTANTWGEEIYFAIPVKAPLEDGRSVVEIGDLGYWPPGRAFCIFFGKTPMSTDEEIRPAGAVNMVGKILGNLEPLKKVRDGERITIEEIETSE